MRADHSIDDDGAHRSGLTDAMLEIVQGCGAYGQAFAIFFIPLRDTRIEIPAVIIESRCLRDLLHAVERLVLELTEADDDVGYSNAEVVDVVLYFDGRAAEAQDADERVAERGVSKMPDVRCLVRVDGCVLDDGLARVGVRRGDFASQACRQKRRTIQIQVQI